MVQIDELTMRIPGLNADQGKQLGEDVAQRVAAALQSESTDRHVPEVNVRLTVPAGADHSQLAESIARQIIAQLRLAIS
jgi:hypothetical protein